MKQDVYRLKALLDHPEYESFDWDVQLSKMLDDIAWWHKYEHKRHLTNAKYSDGEVQGIKSIGDILRENMQHDKK